MTEWGQSIWIDSEERPDWIGDSPVWDVQINRKSNDAGEFEGNWCWKWIKEIRLPANHPHYRTEATMVDWNGKLVVIYPDGRKVEAKPYNDDGHAWPDDDGQYHIDAGGMLLFANEDGSNYFPELHGGGWAIRNTPQAPSQPHTAPSQENGSVEAFERMKALVEAVCALNLQSCSLTGTPSHNVAIEARAIMALLAPVDGDLVEARELLAQRYETFGDNANAAATRRGDWDDVDGYIPWLLKAIKRGRQLERGGE